MRSVIYALSDPRDSALRYIGRAQNLKDRVRLHVTKPSQSTPVGRWITELLSLGLEPVPTVVMTIENGDGIDGWTIDDAIYAAERAVIAWYEKQGADLLNVAGTSRHSEYLKAAHAKRREMRALSQDKQQQ